MNASPWNRREAHGFAVYVEKLEKNNKPWYNIPLEMTKVYPEWRFFGWLIKKTGP